MGHGDRGGKWGSAACCQKEAGRMSFGRKKREWLSNCLQQLHCPKMPSDILDTMYHLIEDICNINQALT